MKLISYLRKIGVDDKLHEMGAKDGDIVTLCDFEFEYFE
jgi:GTP-binding protein